MAKLIVGNAYADLARNDNLKLIYIGPGPSHEVFSAGHNPNLVQVMRDRVAMDVVDWDGDLHRPLEPKQLWARTRHDYQGQVAEILIPPFEHQRQMWVVYTVHYGSSAGPQMKAEKDFRRIFGKYIEPTNED